MTFIVLDQAILHFSRAAHSLAGALSMWFTASSKWANCTWLYQHSSLLEAYAVIFDLLPQFVQLGLPMHDCHHEIISAGTVVSDAISAAIKCGKFDTAVEWLEQGHSIIWGELLQFSTPVDNLWKIQPDLADQLILVSNKLDQISTQDPLADASIPMSLEQTAQQHRQLTFEWEKLVEEI